jgi:hypothetical protein
MTLSNWIERRVGLRPDVVVVVLSSLLALGCDLTSTHHRFEDEGLLCLYPAESGAATVVPPNSPQVYAVDRAIEVTVTMPACLSSSCSHDAMASCTAEVEGTVIRVRSKASYRQQGVTCTDDCGLLAARCSTPPLPAGTYEVRHGVSALTITVPSNMTLPCVGKGLGGL